MDRTEFLQKHPELACGPYKDKILQIKKWKDTNWAAYREYLEMRYLAKLCGAKLAPSQTVKAIYRDNIVRHGRLTCELCSTPIETEDFSIDHEIPRAEGGSNERSNLKIAHLGCNDSKGSRTSEQWKASPTLRFSRVKHVRQMATKLGVSDV